MNQITIGEYTLTRGKDGSLWIGREGGEGMQCNAETEDRLKDLLELFWEQEL